jgi:excisionase family DNA binding protein
MGSPDQLFPRLPELDIAVPPRGNVTLEFFIHAIAQQVAAEVKAELEQFEQAPHVQPVLLTVRDAAVYLGRSEQSIQHLIFERELPVVRVGRRVHLDRRDLDTWIEKNKY